MKQLRPYQQEIIKGIKECRGDFKEIVMAMCPNAGKTYTTIKLLEDFLDSGYCKKVLILAHGTTVLRTQFFEALVENEPTFSFCEFSPENKDLSAQVVVSLPQGLTKKSLAAFDLIIVDEAHERYLADQVQKIVKKSSPKNILLLTGTPAKFIRKNNLSTKGDRFKIFNVAMSDIPSEFMADVRAFICTSSYNIKDEDFGESDDVKSELVNNRFNKKDTEKTIDIFLNSMVKVLKIKNLNQIDNLFKLAFGKLKKTMIICRSQKQANYINKYLMKKGVNSTISTEIYDPESENIEKFRVNVDIKVLIVVNRGILGFNLPTLQNVIDLSATKNINRMYQAFSRVTRTHKDVKLKRFFKIAPKHETEYTEYNVSAMLSLTHADNISKYDGKSFLENIPLFIEKDEKKRVSTSGVLGVTTIDEEDLKVVDSEVNVAKLEKEIEAIELILSKEDLGSDEIQTKKKEIKRIEKLIKSEEKKQAPNGQKRIFLLKMTEHLANLKKHNQLIFRYKQVGGDIKTPIFNLKGFTKTFNKLCK